MNKYFITFGAGSENYIKAGERLISQVNDTKLFDKTILFTDTFLKKDTIFWQKHSNFITQSKEIQNMPFYAKGIIMKKKVDCT